ncbi:MAG: TetR/AcrR family transcriptional regulator [Nocardioides sp.]|uniref:TetR/AcrR family transcriptional regulator n=1 Tax=Nocardioides sp. TaxID=35761 RepID=UPI0039E63706
MPPRAKPMKPEERRQAIVATVAPMVMESGTVPTTREIAAAAGVAEGTIYRAFDDKVQLLAAVAQHVLDPPGGDAAFAELIAGAPDLAGKVRLVAQRMQETSNRAATVFIALRQAVVAADPIKHSKRHKPGPPGFLTRANEVLLGRLTLLFEQHATELRVEPAVAALVLRSLVYGAQHPGMTGQASLTPEQIAEAVLHGVARKES